MSQQETVLITGATGFVGRGVLERLTQEGTRLPDTRVVALVRTDEAAERVRARGAEPFLGDLMEPSAGLVELIAGASRIVHCAAPHRTRATDRATLDAGLLQHVDPQRTRRLVYVCGSSFFGASDGESWVDESTPPVPFALAPLFLQGLGMLAALQARGLDAVTAYVAGVYGRGSWFLEYYLRSIARGEPILLLEEPPIWPYVHIADVAAALAHLLTLPAARLDAEGRDVIVTDDKPVPMDQFILEVSRAVGKPANLLRLDAETIKAKLDAIRFAYLSTPMRHSNARLRRLGFSCAYPTIFEGIPALGLGAPSGPA
jgi:nucleoside-diphosphate-sugar epimerase